MVTRIQTPSPFANAQIDFSKIGQLADSYFKAQEGTMKHQAFQEDRAAKEAERQRQAQIRNTFSGGLPTGPDGQIDFAAMAKAIAPHDPNQAASWAGMAGEAADRSENRQHRKDQLNIQRQQLAQGSTPAAVREYKFYHDQEKAAGRTPVSFADYRKADGSAGFSLKDRTSTEEGLRKEYAAIAKPYFEVRDAFNRIEKSATDPSAAGDLALIFNYMKMLDPGSVVREGEFATAQNAAGVPDMVRNLWNRLQNGERMNPAQRTDFVTRAKQLYQGQEEQYRNIQMQYQGIAERIGVDPKNTILNYGRPGTEDGWVNAGDGVRIREKR